MGYAMFSSREVMLVSQINDLQYRLTELTMKQQDLAQMSSAFMTAAQENGYSFTEGQYQNQTESDVNSENSLQDPEGTLEKISLAEKQIEMESKRLQTQLQAKQTELEAVSQGKEQGIKNATPKYA